MSYTEKLQSSVTLCHSSPKTSHLILLKRQTLIPLQFMWNVQIRNMTKRHLNVSQWLNRHKTNVLANGYVASCDALSMIVMKDINTENYMPSEHDEYTGHGVGNGRININQVDKSTNILRLSA